MKRYPYFARGFMWEMIVTFILSQQSNIPRIKSMIQRISEWYGDKKETGEGHGIRASESRAA